MKPNFKDSLLASGFVKKKNIFYKPIFGTVELAFTEGDEDDLDDQFDDEWFVYLNDKSFSATMESVFENDGNFFNAYMARKLRKDKSGNLGMVMALLSASEDNGLCFHSGSMEISTEDFLKLPSDITNYSSLIDHMLSGPGLGTFFSFTEGYYVYLYLCCKADWSAEKTHKTLYEEINTAPFLAEYMSKKNIEMIDDQFIERFFSHVK